MIVTIADVRLAGYCWAGIRLFAKRHQIDWDKLSTEGVPSESLPDDAMCAKAIMNAKKREEQDGRR